MANVKRLNENGPGKKSLRKVGVSGKSKSDKGDDDMLSSEDIKDNSKRDDDARQNALARPETERDFAKRPDRVGKYLKKYMKDFKFDKFTDSYLKRANLPELIGVPIPLRKEDMEAFKSEKGLAAHIIGENMMRVIGIDPRFPHADPYLSYIEKLIGKKGVQFVVKGARRESARGDYDSGCIHFRAALMLDPIDLGAMYGYARTCRALYNSENATEEFVGNYKAEAFEYFEMLTEIHPKYAQGWYYLGYQYLNMGLYTKAYLAWESFMPNARSRKDRKEIAQRMEQIKMPMEIEKGCNSVMAGRWQEGLSILEPFSESVYQDWWPLWYYLGVAYINLDDPDDAENAFKRTLKLNASHSESMQELLDIYRAKGNAEMIKKYENKLQIVKNN